jgi:hypothetical protein
MDIYSFLATVILIASIVSCVMAFAAYIAYKIRDMRAPDKNRRVETDALEPIFLKPAQLEEVEETTGRQ